MTFKEGILKLLQSWKRALILLIFPILLAAEACLAQHATDTLENVKKLRDAGDVSSRLSLLKAYEPFIPTTSIPSVFAQLASWDS